MVTNQLLIIRIVMVVESKNIPDLDYKKYYKLSVKTINFVELQNSFYLKKCNN